MVDIRNSRRTAVLIDLQAIKYNLLQIRKRVGNHVKICAVVKADAYGHGAKEVSSFIEEEKLADYFAVATVIEGFELRKNGIKLPILILGLIMPDETLDAIRQELTITVSDESLVDVIDDIAVAWCKKAKVHLKIDTGMGRIGCHPENALALAQYIHSKSNIFFEGIFSHFSTSESKDKTYSDEQLNSFLSCIRDMDNNNIHVPLLHMANSGAILDLPNTYFNMVRAGIMIYGVYPSEDVSHSIALKPAMSMKSAIVFIKKLPKGHPISYGNTYKTTKETYIATIPAGYADGIPRSLSNKYRVYIQGNLYPIAGRVCMDQFLVELGDKFFPIGTEVEIFGGNGFSISELAEQAHTIPHEIMIRMKRPLRYYL